MFLTEITNAFPNSVDEMALLLGVSLCIFFYREDKKCKAEIEKQELLDHFLKDHSLNQQ